MATSTGLWAQAAEVFSRALELPAPARAALLEQACAAHPDPAALRQALARLLAAHEAMEAEDAGAAGDALPWRGGVQLLGDARLWSDDDHGRLAAGERAGPFVIERELGAGGMGRVYLARRAVEGLEQRVALKLAASPLWAPQVQRRLRRERELLASLEHPNIARLIDVGELPSGQPYFAMEYVDGEPILAWCDRRRLPLRARIELALQALAAVDYAHRRLVLHRDLKSGNVLVDGEGRARLLDFGIAKALAPGADGAATVDAQAFFSPASAAPEQALGAPTSVATDVYALGVLLYELLCGQLPIATDGRGAAELAQAIAHELPMLPSRRLAALEQREPARARAIAQARGAASARALRRQLHGDLDAILARCLRKEPEQRYASVERLAEDLRAALRSRPVAARGGERWYRLGKFARRQRVPLALAALAVALALGFVVHTALQSRELAQARDRAEARRHQAERVTAFMVDLFRASDPLQARGRDPGARELLQRAAQRLQQIRDPDTRAALAAAIAEVELNLGEVSAAQRHAAEALELRLRLPQPDPMLLRQSYRQNAQVALARADYAAAGRFLDQAQRRLPAQAQDEALTLLRLRAQLSQAQGRLQQALAQWQRADAAHRRRYGADDPRSAQVRRGWASALLAAGQERRAAQLLAQLPAPRSDGRDDDPALAKALASQARQRRDAGDFVQAEQLSRRALGIVLKVYGERHEETASVFNQLGTIAQGRGDPAAAMAWFQRALTVRRDLLGPDHPDVARSEFNLGTMRHLFMGDARGAEPHLRRAVEIAAAATPTHLNLAMYRLGWAMDLHDLGRIDAARAALAPALRRFGELPGQTLNLALARAEDACLAPAPWNAAQARAFAEARATVSAELDPQHPKRRRVEDCAQRHAAAATTQRAALPGAPPAGAS
ncbi:serine/threonine protein kinase [Lysobacter sp. yr284]|uniref:serine/threonine-protein kinase n=1 Tax=Lysobacter sp. yr284 TaxID=1761791 RepID=UPI00089B5234|nr:serine/threonine-protein kinase [Lysobacter sp. yr284]SDZ08748.1 serine/threonine protein kinase [Lysobacter sp. yr284]